MRKTKAETLKNQIERKKTLCEEELKRKLTDAENKGPRPEKTRSV